MKVNILYFFLFIVFSSIAKAQDYRLGIDYGRTYALFKSKDFGNGFVPEPGLSHHFHIGLSLNKSMNNNLFLETGARFTRYEEYFSTKMYQSAFWEPFPVIHVPLLIGYESPSRFGFTGSAGIILGFMIERYQGTFRVNYHPDATQIDSITRGTINREQQALFPLLNINAGLKYSINNRWLGELKLNYGKGFSRISELDIYYNSGSGRNDQFAQQWSTGDFNGLTLSIKYKLRNKD